MVGHSSAMFRGTTYWFLFAFFLMVLSRVLGILFAPSQFSQTKLPNRIEKMCTKGNEENDKIDFHHGFHHGGGLKAENTLGTRLR